MQSSPLLPLLPGPLWLEVVAPDRVLSMGQIERNFALILTESFEIELVLFAKLNCLI